MRSSPKRLIIITIAFISGGIFGVLFTFYFPDGFFSYLELIPALLCTAVPLLLIQPFLPPEVIPIDSIEVAWLPIDSTLFRFLVFLWNGGLGIGIYYLTRVVWPLIINSKTAVEPINY